MAKNGYVSDTFHEAQELVAASDAVLTLADGLNVVILCLVDATRDPARTFALPPERVSQIAAQCRVHTATMGPARGIVTVSVIEVGRAVSSERRERLAAYKRSSVFARIYVSAYALDAESRSVWTNSPLRGGWMRRSFQRLLEGPRLAPKELTPREAAFAPERFPFATAFVAALLAVVFYLQIRLNIGPNEGPFPPSLKTLVGFGGLIRDGVANGDWFRFFMAPVLHGGALHLAFNLLALYLAGRIFERMAGWAWFGAVFILSALGGGAASLAWNASNVVAVGASGAISGLLAAAYVCSFRMPIGPPRTRIQGSLLLVLIPSLLPVVSAPSGGRIDIAAHVGGAAIGGLMGWVMRRNWPDALPVPRFERAAAILTVAGMVALGASALATRHSYAGQALSLQLVPPDELPKTDAAMIEQAETLIRRYPRDPRLHFGRGLKAMDDGDAILAERSFRTALAEEEILRSYLTPDFEVLVRSGLALTLAAQGKPEGREVAAPLCGRIDIPMVQVLRKNGLCP